MERLGYFGEFFQVAGHVPESITTFMKFTAAVKAPLSDRQNELLALTVCAALGGDYERIQHERLSVRLGLDKAWIAALTGRADADEDLLTDEDKALRNLALAVVERRGVDVDAELRAVRACLDEEKTVAAMLQITRFSLIATLNNAFAMKLPVPSIFDAEA
ncbi:carboxymuconolactone decarboxylase family protein [Oceanibacterium hippocampi]|uniref:carboxymuconolactone decarboxylase family protein n=1 Tax=Oceanibacterium hippocampi TaxID=745714 RepID=UPI00159363E0|nr:carboxymuconolactone decarboxylase family protein [Oceanibacterium hippocampi]